MASTERDISMSRLSEVFDKEIPLLLENSWLDKEKLENRVFETLRCGLGRSIPMAINFIVKLHAEDERVNDLVNELNHLAKRDLQSIYVADFIKFFELLVSSMEEQLKVFFTVPKSKLIETTWDTNELVAFFLNFLVGLLDIILRHHTHPIDDAHNSIKILQKMLKFLITFLGETPFQPTAMEETKCLLADIEEFANEVGSLIYSFILKPSSMMNGIVEAIFDFKRKNKVIRMKITELHGNVSRLQSGLPSKSTSVISIFVVDSLIGILKDILDQKKDLTVEVKDQIRTIHDELLYFGDAKMKQRPELEHVMMQITETACELEYLIKSFTHFWYLNIRFPHFVEKIKLIRMASEEIEKNESGMLQVEKYPREPISLQAEKSEEVVVGFEDEAMKIANQLLEKSMHQKIISIFGMSGLGKTTLAKKLYYDPSIVYHFDKGAWCIVSQTYQKRNVLIDILTSLSDPSKDVIANMEEDDMGEAIYKSLKRMRYLIVIDDIWHIEVWDDLKRYFPDDKTQSRILFTTRIKGLA